MTKTIIMDEKLLMNFNKLSRTTKWWLVTKLRKLNKNSYQENNLSKLIQSTLVKTMEAF